MKSLRKKAESEFLNESIEQHRDLMWHRTPDLRVENAIDAERMIEEIGFCATLTDSRQRGPSLYIAVCGRRDAHMPRNVQKDPEMSLAWFIKDEVMRRGNVYYSKLIRGKSTFVARSLIPHFNAIWGLQRKNEAKELSSDARAILKVLHKEWEMGTADLKRESGLNDRARFTRAIDELQKRMKVIPTEVLYEPFTYIWSLAEGRFASEISQRVSKESALREIARAFLKGAGLTFRGELSKVTGLRRPDAGIGNHALVKEKFAERVTEGVYCRAGLSRLLCYGRQPVVRYFQPKELTQQTRTRV